MSNVIFLHADDAASGGPLYLRINQHAFVARSAEGVARGSIALNSLHRRLLQVSLGEHVQPVAIVPCDGVHEALLEFAPLKARRLLRTPPLSFCRPELVREIHAQFNGHVITSGLTLAIKTRGRLMDEHHMQTGSTHDTTILLTVRSPQALEPLTLPRFATLQPCTRIVLEAATESDTVPTMRLHEENEAGVENAAATAFVGAVAAVAAPAAASTGPAVAPSGGCTCDGCGCNASPKGTGGAPV